MRLLNEESNLYLRPCPGEEKVRNMSNASQNCTAALIYLIEPKLNETSRRTNRTAIENAYLLQTLPKDNW